jgi:photosystem II stability/assembly factor-like uncharacterized protein
MSPVTAVRLADAKSGWIGGMGFIARTDDGGGSWTVQYRGDGEVKQLFALNATEAWAVIGDNRMLLRTADGGKHWTEAGQVPNDGFLHFVNPQEAYSGNARTVDGGRTWTVLPVPQGLVGDAYFHDRQNAWAVVQGNGSIGVERTLDGGQTWSKVMTRPVLGQPTGAIIRSAGSDDAWVELIGDSGMSQTSYSLFHTTNGGKDWLTVLAHSTAGAGPAPGVAEDEQANRSGGSRPGPLYVVSPDAAFMGGQCPACDKPNTVGWTVDGGETWVNGTEELPGYGVMLLAMADAKQGWLITNEASQPSVMYTTDTGGTHWKKVHAFAAPQ